MSELNLQDSDTGDEESLDQLMEGLQGRVQNLIQVETVDSEDEETEVEEEEEESNGDSAPGTPTHSDPSGVNTPSPPRHRHYDVPLSARHGANFSIREADHVVVRSRILEDDNMWADPPPEDESDIQFRCQTFDDRQEDGGSSVDDDYMYEHESDDELFDDSSHGSSTDSGGGEREIEADDDSIENLEAEVKAALDFREHMLLDELQPRRFSCWNTRNAFSACMIQETMAVGGIDQLLVQEPLAAQARKGKVRRRRHYETRDMQAADYKLTLDKYGAMATDQQRLHYATEDAKTECVLGG